MSREISRNSGYNRYRAAQAGKETDQVSHETIYRSLFVQARGVLKKELLMHLRSQRRMRRPGPKKWQGDTRGQIKDMVSIRERPASVEDRAVPGHWEGDLLSVVSDSWWKLVFGVAPDHDGCSIRRRGQSAA